MDKKDQNNKNQEFQREKIHKLKVTKSINRLNCKYKRNCLYLFFAI